MQEGAGRLVCHRSECKFGVHPEFGATCVDCCGAPVLYAGRAVQEVTADQIRFERTTYRRTPVAPLGVPIWQFGTTEEARY